MYSGSHVSYQSPSMEPQVILDDSLKTTISPSLQNLILSIDSRCKNAVLIPFPIKNSSSSEFVAAVIVLMDFQDSTWSSTISSLEKNPMHTGSTDLNNKDVFNDSKTIPFSNSYVWNRARQKSSRSSSKTKRNKASNGESKIEFMDLDKNVVKMTTSRSKNSEDSLTSRDRIEKKKSAPVDGLLEGKLPPDSLDLGTVNTRKGKEKVEKRSSSGKDGIIPGDALDLFQHTEHNHQKHITSLSLHTDNALKRSDKVILFAKHILTSCTEKIKVNHYDWKFLLNYYLNY